MEGRSTESASRFVAVLLITLALAFAVEPLLSLGAARLDGTSLAGVLAVLALFCIAVAHVLWRGTQGSRPTRRKPYDLVIAGFAATAMCLQFGPAWAALLAVTAGAAAFTLTRYRAIGVMVIALAAECYAAARLHVSATQFVDLLGRGVIVCIVIYAVGKMVALGQEINRNRAELARLAVVEERLRFSRDLHDLLGHTLSVIALRSEAATKLAGRDLPRALTEMDAVAESSRNAISDVRSLVRGYRRQSLAAEIEGVVSVLEAAGVRCEAGGVPASLPAQVQEALGWVVREAVTNVLRHSNARLCTIGIRTVDGKVIMEVSNDGADSGGRGLSHGTGHGLEGLAERLALSHGSVSHEITPDKKTFRLRAEITVASVPLRDKRPTDRQEAP